MAIYCSNCGVELPDGVSFCDACGTPVRGQGAAAPVGTVSTSTSTSAGTGVGMSAGNGLGTTSCPVCGASAMPGEAFCDNCGASLMASASGAPSTSYSPPPSYSSAPMGSSGGTYGSTAPAPAPSRQLQASLVITAPPPPATIQIPNRNELIVGRSDPQSNSYPDVDLGPYGGLDLGVSRRHFRLTRTGDNFYLEDLNAMNGSVVNGQRVPPYTLQPLRNGDRIVLGKLEMVFEVA